MELTKLFLKLQSERQVMKAKLMSTTKYSILRVMEALKLSYLSTSAHFYIRQSNSTNGPLNNESICMHYYLKYFCI